MEEGNTPKEIDLSNVRYIIFDWDGTLVDTMPGKSQAFARALANSFKQLDQASARAHYLATAGAPLSEQLRGAAQKFAHQDLPDTAQLQDQFYLLIKGQPVKVYEGATQTLERLKKQGLKIIVWSSSRHLALAEMLQTSGLQQFIDFFIGSNPQTPNLTKGPAMFAEIAKHLQISPEELQHQSLVIGDGQADIEAGRKSGCRTIGLTTTQSREELAKAGPNLILAKISDLMHFLS